MILSFWTKQSISLEIKIYFTICTNHSLFLVLLIVVLMFVGQSILFHGYLFHDSIAFLLWKWAQPGDEWYVVLLNITAHITTGNAGMLLDTVRRNSIYLVVNVVELHMSWWRKAWETFENIRTVKKQFFHDWSLGIWITDT